MIHIEFLDNFVMDTTLPLYSALIIIIIILYYIQGIHDIVIHIQSQESSTMDAVFQLAHEQYSTNMIVRKGMQRRARYINCMSVHEEVRKNNFTFSLPQLNRERVGTFVPGEEGGWRDVVVLGECDEGVVRMCQLCGWEGAGEGWRREKVDGSSSSNDSGTSALSRQVL